MDIQEASLKGLDLASDLRNVASFRHRRSALRLLFLSKRYPQQRDLLTRPYGRFYHLPVALAAMGHEVHVVVVSHRSDADVEGASGGVSWTGRDIKRLGPRGLMRRLDEDVKTIEPDWIIGCSDAWISCLAHRLANASRASLALDAYDDFESYMPWNLPLHFLYRRAIRCADLVTAAGPQLAKTLDRHRSGQTPSLILPMAADPAFAPKARAECRQVLRLPPDAPILGYYGGWAKQRGTAMLLPAFRALRRNRPDALLALTGRPPSYVLREPGVVALGYLEDALLPSFVNAVNLSCVITADTRFGRGSYPAKLCEAMACGVAVVATATEPVRWMMSDREDLLVPVGDPEAFAAAALSALTLDRVDYGPQPNWHQVAAELNDTLRKLRPAGA